MESKWTWIAVGIGVVVAAAGAFSKMRRVEEPTFTHVEHSVAFGLQDYASLLIAEATLKAGVRLASTKDFVTLPMM